MSASEGSTRLGSTWFVRYGPEGRVVGPFAHRHTALAWLEFRGFTAAHEGAAFKLYAAEAPDAPLSAYWGCTTFGCERGFNGAEEDMPRGWEFCPSCGGPLAEITNEITKPPDPPSAASGGERGTT